MERAWNKRLQQFSGLWVGVGWGDDRGKVEVEEHCIVSQVSPFLLSRGAWREPWLKASDKETQE